jgi:hypothetical protein
VAATITYPNGAILASSAFTVPAMAQLWQTLTCALIGVNPPNYARVTVDWQQEGQPFVARPIDDRCALLCVPQDVEYSRVRDASWSGTGLTGDPLVQTWVYTKGWRVAWTAYGPAAEDNLRAVRSGLFLDWVNDQLNQSKLYPVNDPREVAFAPENFNAQWWPRADFEVTLYEQVTETLTWPAGAGFVESVEIKLYSDRTTPNLVDDFTVTKT